MKATLKVVWTDFSLVVELVVQMALKMVDN